MLTAARPLLDELMDLLERRERGVRALLLEAFRVDGGRSRAGLRLSRPTRDADHLERLLVDRLDGWHAEFGYDALAVEAVTTEPLSPRQLREHGEGSPRGATADPHALIDRLRARLGARAVLRPVARASHWPERAEAWLPLEAWSSTKAWPPAKARSSTKVRSSAEAGLPLEGVSSPGANARGRSGPQGRDDAPACVPRPERLFDPPEPIAVIHAVPDGPPARFTWRHVAHDVSRAAGYERIAPEWWRERSTARSRDYWRVETREGRRLWLFREGFEDDEREGRPRWFCHGVFA